MSLLPTHKVQSLSSLRRRLIVASLGLATVVSLISIIVANRLSIELGKSTELRAIQEKSDILLAQFTLAQNYEDRLRIFNGLLNSRKFRTTNTSIIVNSSNGERFQHGITENILPVIDSLNLTVAGSGSVTSLREEYIWAYTTTEKKPGYSILVIRYPESLDQALMLVTKRLSITAFLTFWLSLWSALIASAFIIKNITKNHNQLVHMATHDALTGLPNRLYLTSQIENFAELKLLTASDHRPHVASLLLIDLDRFKEVNDTLGHSIGDDLLVAVSNLLKSGLNENHILARFGGDEFIVWCPDTNEEEATSLAESLAKTCRQQIQIENHYLEIGASIGISCFPEHGQKADNLIKRADIAMYQAKRSRQVIKVYDKNDDTHTVFKVKLSSDICSALEREEFIIHYQPKVAIKTRRISGVEALIRWQHPEFGLIYPDNFINLIEQSGHINAFTLFVIKESIKQIRCWQDQNYNLSVAVNISPYNLTDKSLISNVSELLAKYEIPPELLEFELTETATMLDIEATKTAFNQLKELGIKLSIDDFGTGMSSLAYIKELNVDYIKIDKSFILNIAEDQRDKAIVSATIDLIRQLGQDVIAEGIESEFIADILKELNCRYGQGYYFARPLPLSEVNKLLDNRLPVLIPSKTEILKSLAEAKTA